MNLKLSDKLLIPTMAVFSVYMFFDYKQQLEEDVRGLFIRRHHSKYYELNVLSANFKTIKYDNTSSTVDFQVDEKYEIDLKAAKDIVEASHEIHQLCLETVDKVVKSDELMDLFEIPNFLRPAIRDSWRNKQADIIAKLIFLHDAQNLPKFYEYDSDASVGLYEAARCQAMWGSLEYKSGFQFNFIKNALDIVFDQILLNSQSDLHFVRPSIVPSNEINLLTDVSRFKGREVHSITLNNVEYSPDTQKLISNEIVSDSTSNQHIRWMYSFIPWYRLGVENLADFISKGLSTSNTTLNEPPWKMILESRALLPYLWSQYPNNPYLLPAYFANNEGKIMFEANNKTEDEEKKTKWVAVPLYGKRTSWMLDSSKFESPSHFFKAASTPFTNHGRRIIQQFYETPLYRDKKMKLATWIVYGAPVGLGVFEESVLGKDVFTVHEIKRFSSAPDQYKLHDYNLSNQSQLWRGLYGKLGERLVNDIYKTRNEYLGSNFRGN